MASSLGFSNIDENGLILPPREKEKGLVTYYKAVARGDGRFDLYSYIDGEWCNNPTIVPYQTVKSLNKDNMVTVEGAWLG